MGPLDRCLPLALQYTRCGAYSAGMNAVSGSLERRRHRTGWLLACVLAASSPAGADVAIHGRFYGFPAVDPGTSIDLQVAGSEQDIARARGGDAGTIETTRIGLSWYEAIAPNTRLGFTLGRQGVTLDDGPTTDSDLYGYFGALRLDSAWPVGDAGPWIEVRAELGYAEADADSADDRTELDWWHASLRPAIHFPLGDRVQLWTGIDAEWIDGREQSAGDSFDFEQDGTLGGFVGIGVRTDPGGRVYLQAEGGPSRGVQVVFERRY